MASLQERAELIQSARNNPTKQAALMELCRRDPVFWFNTFGYTLDPRDGKGDLPFNLYPFQEWFVVELVERIRAQKDIDIEKSRTMGVSWMIMGVFLWMWLYEPNFSALIGSITQEDVDKNMIDPEDTLFGKIRYMFQMLPAWMKPDATDKHLTFKNNRNGNSITGKAPVANFGRGARKTVIFYDELAFWQWARSAYASASQTTKCRITNSTPNGKYNLYGERMTDPDNVRVTWPGRAEMMKEKGLAA